MNRNHFRLAKVLILCAGALGVFVLPWYFPPSELVDSVSYAYGFNNRLAAVAVGGTVLALSLLRIWRTRNGAPPDALDRCLGDMLSFDGNPARNRRLRIAALGTAMVALAIAAGWYAILPYTDFGEMSYFTSRIELMALGYRPYADFEFIYGALLVYPQFWLYRIAAGALSIEAAYGIVFIAHALTGIGLVYLVFSKFGGRSDLTLPFLGIIAPALVGLLGLGLNYTFLRFVGPVFSLVFVHCYAVRRSFPVRLAVALASVFICFLLSPEVGVGALVTLGAYFALRRDYAVAALASIAPALAILLLFGRDYFAGMRAFGAGAGALPLFPTVHALIYVAALALFLPRLATAEWQSGGERKGIAGALFVMILALTPAALGRCDCGHIFYNALALFSLALAANASCAPPTWRRSNYAVYVVSFILLSAVTFWGHYDERVITALKTRWGILKHGQGYRLDRPLRITNPALIYSKPEPRIWPHLEELLQYDRLGTPLGSEPQIDRLLKLKGSYMIGYHNAHIMTPAILQRELAGIDRMPRVLVPERAIFPAGPVFDEDLFNRGTSDALRRLLLFPVSFRKVKQPPFMAWHEIATYLREHFEIERHWEKYLIMRRKEAPREVSR